MLHSPDKPNDRVPRRTWLPGDDSFERSNSEEKRRRWDGVITPEPRISPILRSVVPSSVSDSPAQIRQEPRGGARQKQNVTIQARNIGSEYKPVARAPAAARSQDPFRAGQIVPIRYLRAAQAYMLISMPTGTSTIFGVFQVIQASQG
jgi:hypothetical protein